MQVAKTSFVVGGEEGIAVLSQTEAVLAVLYPVDSCCALAVRDARALIRTALPVGARVFR